MGDGKRVVKRCLGTVFGLLRALCGRSQRSLRFRILETGKKQHPKSQRSQRTAAERAEKSKCLVSYG